MDKIKRILMITVPLYMLIISLTSGWKGKENAFDKLSPELVAKAFSKKRVGGICYVNFCARGETLFYSQII